MTNPTNKQLYDKMEEIHKDVIQVATVTLGVPGTDDTGLVGEVANHNKKIGVLFSKLNKISLRLWILIGILVGSGVITGKELLG